MSRLYIETIKQTDHPGLSQAVKLTWQVWEQMEVKEWYVPDDEKEILQRLEQGRGRVYCARLTSSGERMGVLIMTFPGISSDNLGLDAGFDGDQLLKVAQVDSVAILPQFRGNGLQRKLSELAEREAAEMGYRCLMCTVHPDNQFSRDNMLKLGYRVIMSAVKYGGFRREILMKDL